MIETTSFKWLYPDQVDLALAIVHDYKVPIPGVIHVPALAPCDKIYKAEVALKQFHTWDKKVFDTIIEPAFTEQIWHDAYAQRLLKRIVELDKQGKRISLACYCKDAETCHRSIIAAFLRGLGAEVYEN